jgi:hypothetical protein
MGVSLKHKVYLEEKFNVFNAPKIEQNPPEGTKILTSVKGPSF